MTTIDKAFGLDTAAILRKRVSFTDELDYARLKKSREPELTEYREMGSRVPIWVAQESLFPRELIESYGCPNKTPKQVELELLDIAFEHFNRPTDLRYRLIKIQIDSPEEIGLEIAETFRGGKLVETFRDYELVAYYPEYREWILSEPQPGDFRLSNNRRELAIAQSK